jgi:hypothetical protein
MNTKLVQFQFLVSHNLLIYARQIIVKPRLTIKKVRLADGVLASLNMSSS